MIVGTGEEKDLPSYTIGQKMVAVKFLSLFSLWFNNEIAFENDLLLLW